LSLKKLEKNMKKTLIAAFLLSSVVSTNLLAITACPESSFITWRIPSDWTEISANWDRNNFIINFETGWTLLWAKARYEDNSLFCDYSGKTVTTGESILNFTVKSNNTYAQPTGNSNWTKIEGSKGTFECTSNPDDCVLSKQ
jgi:hypothetical protein